MRRVVVLVLLGALGAGAGACAGPQELRLYAEFADVGDLVSRAHVQQSDTVVGRVGRIELRGWTARVELILDPGVRVPQGTRAVVRSTSLLGEKFVDLQPPPGVTAGTPLLRNGATIPLERTGKAPEVEEVFTQLGAILATGALEDLGRLVTATARIVEGQEDDIGRVLDGTARLVRSLANQKEAIAAALASFADAAATLRGGSDTVSRFLQTTARVGEVLAGQTGQLEDLVVQLDRLGSSGGRLLREHRAEMDRAIKALLTIVPQVHAARADLDRALGRLPSFARLFAAAIPGDYIQLDVHL